MILFSVVRKITASRENRREPLGDEVMKTASHRNCTLQVTLIEFRMLAKRRKVDDECRSFNEEWTEKYFSILHFGKPTCLICNQSVAVNKELILSVIMRHETKHSKFSEYRGQTRKDKINRLKLCLENQCSIFQKQNTESQKNTQASYEVAKLIAKKHETLH